MTHLLDSELIVYRCDVCGKDLNTLTKIWRQAVEALRKHGWTVNPLSAPPSHKCAECRFNPGGTSGNSDTKEGASKN